MLKRRHLNRVIDRVRKCGHGGIAAYRLTLRRRTIP